MGSLLRLEIARTFRNPVSMVFLIGFPLALYLLWTKVLPVSAGTGITDFAAYSMVSMATYGSLGGALFIGGAIALERTGGWLRQLAVTPLPGHGYVVAKLVAGMLGVLPSIVAVLAAGAALGGVRLAGTTWVVLVPLIWLGVLPFAALGVALGYSLAGQSANMAMIVVYFGLSVLGGLWVPVEALPDGLRAVAEYSPAYQAGSLGWRALDGLAPTGTAVAVLAGWTLLFCALAVWRYRRAL
ncbi:ABC transporter [Microtetraspora sp. NBRC 13810]|uniref:ABC transporter permease n=1 Tax=Microtetraspora sp. NBRC 13810 TaxID=3030990 RepID=UPI0024A171B4|nr:ABC transporter permease [Microtetraspora sp. NBRC 13810]GLW05991.1 ABC transporter [Microtetraspora sp. NBRC 13810]